jgi:coenzyme PQQ synthesis protein D (PqqD)
VHTPERPRSHRDAICKVVDGEGLIVHSRTGSYHVLNAVGTHVWQLLDGTRDLPGLARAVADEFEVDAVRAEADVREFIGALASLDMLEQG